MRIMHVAIVLGSFKSWRLIDPKVVCVTIHNSHQFNLGRSHLIGRPIVADTPSLRHLYQRNPRIFGYQPAVLAEELGV